VQQNRSASLTWKRRGIEPLDRIGLVALGSAASHDLHRPGSSRRGGDAECILVPMTRRSGDSAGYVYRLGNSLREYNSSAAVPIVTIRPTPSPAAKHGPISQEVISQERTVEVTHMARMSAARHATTTTTTTTTRQSVFANCYLACRNDQHRSQSQSFARHNRRSGGPEAQLLTLSLRRKFHVRQAA
jgi:hypothetical protein